MVLWMHLPGINGNNRNLKIREFNSEIPIIAITAISLNENREMLLSFGMNDVVTKPLPRGLFTPPLQIISLNLIL
jgi:CheY-like chemotaxis protein